MKIISLDDLANSLGVSVDDIKDKCSDISLNNLSYRIIEGDEKNRLILDIIKGIESDNYNVGHKEMWRKGWEENYKEFIEGYDLNLLIPKYISINQLKYQPMRYNGEFIKPLTTTFWLTYYNLMMNYIYKTYFQEYKYIYEFGCGTGFNLVKLANIFPDKILIGCDYVSSSLEILDALRKKFNFNISGHYFDMLDPPINIELEKYCGVLTVTSIEQLGGKFARFINYLLRQDIGICVHVEPTIELHNTENLLDYLSIKFIKKRRYSDNLLTYLRKLELDNKIQILKAKTINFGSLMLNGYTLIVWKPKTYKF